jgi:hypothetical protein
MRVILVIRNWILFVRRQANPPVGVIIWNLLFVILSSHSLRRRVVARGELTASVVYLTR